MISNKKEWNACVEEWQSFPEKVGSEDEVRRGEKEYALPVLAVLANTTENLSVEIEKVTMKKAREPSETVIEICYREGEGRPLKTLTITYDKPFVFKYGREKGGAKRNLALANLNN